MMTGRDASLRGRWAIAIALAAAVVAAGCSSKPAKKKPGQAAAARQRAEEPLVAPAEAEKPADAEKPAGEWQTLELTLVDQHATVVLNGRVIIDNQPLPGVTGGALGWDPLRPGPILLQGDHGPVSYRNLVLRPVQR